MSKRILLIDNYDSFTFNLFHYVSEILADEGILLVKKHDAITVEEARDFQPTHIIISPGPGNPTHPHDVGICPELIDEFAQKIPILGVCLGHQLLAYYYGAQIIHAQHVMHGKTSVLEHNADGLFHAVPQKSLVMRYHSLVASLTGFPDALSITATSDDGEIMAFKHKKLPIFGVQFHPESIGTPDGMQILRNFINTPV